MNDTLNNYAEDFLQRLTRAGSADELTALSTELNSKTGPIRQALKSLGDASPEERKSLGALANSIRERLSAELDQKLGQFGGAKESNSPSFDMTMPSTGTAAGTIHPISRLIYDLNDAFAQLGFQVYRGPDVSSEAFDFDALNFPPFHPARESMDTYWLDGGVGKTGADRLALRPHLTGSSVRFMLDHKPPFRVVYPGQAYRNERTDASHERAFFQYEALIVDREVPFSTVRLMVDTILERVFGRPVKTRMRAGFFPFVEPGFEIDMECLVCGAKGCSVCKRVGWLEIMPGGPAHPNVLRAGGIDPNEFQGQYINFGIERILMMKHGIDDLRHFHSGDLRFLKQF